MTLTNLATKQSPIYEERRRHSRTRLNQRVFVTVLGKVMRSLRARLVDYSYNGLGLEVTANVKPGLVLAVEWDGTIVLGEVVYCRAGASQRVFHAGIRTDYIILDRTSGNPA